MSLHYLYVRWKVDPMHHTDYTQVYWTRRPVDAQSVTGMGDSVTDYDTMLAYVYNTILNEFALLLLVKYG